MTPEQEQELADKLTRLGYPAFEATPGEDNVSMLRVQDHLICGALYALALEDEALGTLIAETLTIGE